MILKFNKNIYDDKPLAIPSGDRKAMDFKLAIDDNGNSVLVGEEYDLQEVIDSYRDQCSIERIIQLHGLGDDLIMNQKPGVFLDEEDLAAVKLGQDQAALNTQLFNLYQGYKDQMSFDDFANAILHGDFKVFDKKAEEAPKEVNE